MLWGLRRFGWGDSGMLWGRTGTCGDILANLFPSTMPFWLFANVMLVFLAVLHVWWFYLILRIAYKLIMGIKAADIADDEYEGGAKKKKTK